MRLLFVLVVSLSLLPAAVYGQACVENVRALIDEEFPLNFGAALITADGQGHIGQGRRSLEEGTVQFFWSAAAGLRTVQITPGLNVGLGPASVDGAYVIANNNFLDRPPLRWETATGTLLEIGEPAGTDRFVVTGVTESGTVLGFANDASGFVGSYRWTPSAGFVLLSDTYRIEDVSDDGAVRLGVEIDAQNRVGFPYLWRASTGTWAPLEGFPSDAVSVFASDLSGDGRYVTGLFEYSDRSTEAFRWSGGTLSAMPGWTPGSFDGGQAVANDGTVFARRVAAPDFDAEYVRWAGATIQPLYDVLVGSGLDPALVLRYFGMGPSGSGDGGNVEDFSNDGRVLVTSDDYQRVVRLDGGCAVGIAASPIQGGTLQGSETALVTWDVSGLGPSDPVTLEWSSDGTSYLPVGTAPAVQTEDDDFVGIGVYEWTVPPVNAEAAVLRLTAPGAEELIGPFAIESEVSLALFGPPADSLVTAGEPLTIRWARSAGVAAVDVLLLPDTLGTPEIVLDIALSGDSLAWLVPDTLFSRSARLAVVDATDPTVADTSAFFRLKPYHLARLSDDRARYVPFTPRHHGWQYANTERFWFPSSWWSQRQFDYQDGEDPLSGEAYPPVFSASSVGALPPVFPDWPAYARAFGTDAAFHSLGFFDTIYRYTFLTQWGSDHAGDRWGGSCYGMAAAALLAFTFPLDVEDAYPALGPVEELVAVDTSATAREMVNTLFAYQFGAAAEAEDEVHYFGTTLTSPSQTLDQLKALLARDDNLDDQRILALFDVQSCAPRQSSGGHAVTPYRVARRSPVSDLWDIFIYDPNLPRDTTAAIVVDTAANTWSYAGLGWSGACGLYLMDPILNYLDPAVVPSTRLPSAARALPPLSDERTSGTHSAVMPSLYVSASPDADVTLVGAGGRVGHTAGVPFNTDPAAVPVVPKVGGPALPIGYHVPAGRYALTLAASADTTVAATFFAPDRVMRYGRADADASHTDHLAFDPDAQGGTLTLRSDDTGTTKRVTLRAIDTAEDERERTLDVRDLTLTGADSVRFAAPDAPDGPRLVLTNEGGAKTYTVRLRTASAEGATRFAHAGVALEAGATHTVRPDWGTLATATLEIDRDGDGVPEETVPLANEVAAEDDAPEALPAGVAIASVYPNPARGQATVRYGLPEAQEVAVAVYDLLGRRVAVLADGARPAGWHEAKLASARLPSGLYVVRLEAGGVVETQRFTVVR